MGPSLGAWLLLILLVSLTFDGSEPTHPLQLCLACGRYGAVSGMILNAFLYVPLGYLLRRYTGSAWIAVGAGVALSVSVEAVQLWLPSRYSTLEDLLSNGLGTAVGCALAVRPARWLTPSLRDARTLTLAWSTLAAAIVALPGLLLTPSAPEGDFFALWTPVLASVEVYGGRVLSAEVGGVSLPHGRVPAARGARAPLLGGADVDIVFLAGPRARGVAPIVRVVGNEGIWDEVFELAADRDDLLVRFRYRADDLALERPHTRVRGALAPWAVGDTLRVSIARLGDGGRRVVVNGDAYVDRGPTAGRAWSLLRYPRRLPEGIPPLADFVWLVALFVPLGWWAPSAVWLAVAAGAQLGLMASLPAWAPLAAAPLAHYVAVVVGLGVGLAMRPRGSSEPPDRSARVRSAERSPIFL